MDDIIQKLIEFDRQCVEKVELAKKKSDIDFDTLYAKGKKVILFDLDNTIASYEDVKPNSKQLMLNEKLTKMGYKIYIISNNRIKRVKEFVEMFKVNDYLTLARKPFTKRVCAFIKRNNLNKDEIVMIGDQLLTDIVCANKIGVTNILVKSISRKTERWYTRINRLREERILRKIERIDPKKALEIRNIIGKSSDHSE